MKNIYKVAAAGAMLFGAANCGGETEPTGIEVTVEVDALPVHESPSKYGNEAWVLELGEKALVTCWDSSDFVGVTVGGTDGYVEPYVRVDGQAIDTTSRPMADYRERLPVCKKG